MKAMQIWYQNVPTVQGKESLCVQYGDVAGVHHMDGTYNTAFKVM
jgi:hypothetical protein